MLQVGAWDGTTFRWLDVELNTDVALTESSTLFRAIKAAQDRHSDSAGTGHDHPHKYNNRRLHSSLGHTPPTEFEQPSTLPPTPTGSQYESGTKLGTVHASD